MIRKFKANDIEEIMKIWKKENIKAHNFVARDYWEKNYEYVKNILPNAEIYVYIENNKVLGFIGISNYYIEGIFITSNIQNRGIGTLLLNHVKQYKFRLELKVYQKNLKAIKFYQKNGFKIIKKGVDEDTNEKEFIMLWKNTTQSKESMLK